MILGYSMIGLLLATIGSAPPGASNLAVIKATSSHSLFKGMRIAMGAGLGEVLLAFMALCYSRVITQFFAMNAWIQISFICLFFILGVLFLAANKLENPSPIRLPKQLVQSRFLKGFVLAFLNPPVLLFWIVAISFSQKYLLPLTDMSPTALLSLFFFGVFLGKVLVLYGYAKLGSNLYKNEKINSSNMNRFIGVVLILISMVQGVRFFIN